ncbi:MAG: hypothetical protein LBQ18_06890 [Campylobacteraceae bacterium]|nr:hypothetical protein [Campylobacteraceae bacterium]
MKHILTAIFLVSFTVSGVLASTYKPIIAYVKDAEPVKIGETALVPVQIDIMRFKLKSAKITFELNTTLPLREGVSPNSVIIKEAVVDVSKKAPYTVYVPVTVTGDGMFDFKGTLHIEMCDKENAFKIDSFDYPISFGIFAFDGEVFFGGNSEMAIKNRAYPNLQKNNKEFVKLFDKQQKVYNGILKSQAFSEEEQEKLNQLRRDETNRLLIEFSKRYPIKPSPTSRLIQPMLFNKPQKGETVSLEVKWANSSSHTEFLPLHGAWITILDSADNALRHHI